MKFLEIIDLAYKIDNNGIDCWWNGESYAIMEMRDKFIDMIKKAWSLKNKIKSLEKTNQDIQKLPTYIQESVCICIKQFREELENLNKKIDSIKNMEVHLDEDIFDGNIEEYLRG